MPSFSLTKKAVACGSEDTPRHNHIAVYIYRWYGFLCNSPKKR